MNFVSLTPALRDTLGESVDFPKAFLYLSQVAWLVECLLWGVLSIEMAFTIDSPGQLDSVVFDATVRLERKDSNDLLVQFTGTIVKTVKWADVCLINLVTSTNIRIGQVHPVVSPEGSLIGGPPSEPMHQDYRVIVGPLVSW